MKFVFIADIHLSRYGQDKIEIESDLPTRLDSIWKSLCYVGEYCIKNGIFNITIGGDLLHGKSIIYALAQSLMLDFFRKYPGIEFTVIDGNHDLSEKGSKGVSALKSIDNEPNVNRINTVSHMITVDNQTILYVPYSTDMIPTILQKSADYLISHFGLNEGILNSGISIIADLKLSDLIGKYRKVLLGHYHKPQEILRDDIELYYSGSLIQLDRGEKNEDKRFLIVDTKSDTIVSEPVIGYKKYIEYVMFSSNKDETLKLARENQKNGHSVSIVVDDKDIDVKELQNDFHVVDKTERDLTQRGIDTSMSQKERLKKYLDIKEIPIDNKEKYLNEAMSIINNCTGDDL
jgi:DNA repair exonuclease SbcCD nuclease subunit